MDKVYGNLKDQSDYMYPLKQTVDGSKIGKNFMKNYKMQDVKTQPTSYNISSFEEIGMVDPFPESPMIKRHFNLPRCLGIGEYDTNHLVYDESRYHLDDDISKNIYCLYIPSKEVMFKIMRACVNAQIENDLWFNQNKL